jgi:hypothetical protein
MRKEEEITVAKHFREKEQTPPSHFKPRNSDSSAQHLIKPEINPVKKLKLQGRNI